MPHVIFHLDMDAFYASVEEPMTEAREIYRLGCWLLGWERLVNRPLRLLGLRVSGLTEGELRQLVLKL